MGVQIISSSGTQFGAVVTPQGRLLVDISGATINIGSVTTNESVYVISGNAWSGTGSVYLINSIPTGSSIYIPAGSVIVTNFPITGSVVYPAQLVPTNSIYNNARENIVYSGTAIGSIYKFIGTGSYLKVVSYDTSGNIIGITSWSQL